MKLQTQYLLIMPMGHSKAMLQVTQPGVTLADEDTNSILTDNADRAIQGNGAIWWPILQLMQVAPSNGQICN